jgi:hypothetical protein
MVGGARHGHGEQILSRRLRSHISHSAGGPRGQDIAAFASTGNERAPPPHPNDRGAARPEVEEAGPEVEAGSEVEAARSDFSCVVGAERPVIVSVSRGFGARSAVGLGAAPGLCVVPCVCFVFSLHFASTVCTRQALRFAPTFVCRMDYVRPRHSQIPGATRHPRKLTGRGRDLGPRSP